MKNIFNNKIFVFDDVLSTEECSMLIEYYKCKGHSHEWNGTYPLNIVIEPISVFDSYFSTPFSTPENIVNCFLKIQKIVSKNLDNSIEIDWCEIVKWPENSFMNVHRDSASKNTVFTSVTYLNDDYVGGHTFIKDDIELIPKRGRTICFDGNFYEHGVSKVFGGTRYTIPIWYKKVSPYS